MPLQATSGAASYDAFGGGVAAAPQYIEDVFSTYLYTGNGSTQTITNGIDLAGKGGLVWLKDRSGASINQHTWVDTNRGVNYWINSASTFEQSPSNILSSYNTNGFTLSDSVRSNQSGASYVGWTFREQPKFFDVVTWTGNGANRTIAHNLGSVPGCIIVKRTDTTSNWQVYHRSLTSAANSIQLNLTNAQAAAATVWNSTAPTDTVFSLGTDVTVNASGGTYVAYIYAHNAGGFGLTGTDNVISCGSFTDVASGTVSVNLGYEPQFILYKKSNAVSGWFVQDNMRGMPAYTGSGGRYLSPNSSAAEAGAGNLGVTATGFEFGAGTTDTWIYIAIRRGPMKVPTTGTSVFAPIAVSPSSGQQLTTNFPVDSSIARLRTFSTDPTFWNSRLRGVALTDTKPGNQVLNTTSTAAETGGGPYSYGWDSNTSIKAGSYLAGYSSIYWNFRRAPGFFDEVCYTGTGANRTVAHNLAAVPELMIVKGRSGATDWQVYSSALANTEYLVLNTTAAKATGATRWNGTTPTSSVFSLGTASEVNTSAATYVAYLFASCPGVSKVFNYTGNGSSQTINCGFTGGARFVMIKRTDSTGNWMVVDTARGLVAAGDPTLYLNSTAAEVTGVDWIDPDSSGFIVNQEGTMNANVNGATYIGLAVA